MHCWDKLQMLSISPTIKNTKFLPTVSTLLIQLYSSM